MEDAYKLLEYIYQQSINAAISDIETEASESQFMKKICEEATEKILEFMVKYYSRDSIAQNHFELTHSILNVKNEDFIGIPVKVIGRISSISEPSRVFFKSENKIKTVFNITLTYDNNSIDVLSLPHHRFLKITHDLFKSSKPALFMGTIVPFNTLHGSYIFFLTQISQDITTYDLLQDPDYTLQEIKSKVDHYSIENENGIRGYIKDTLINEIGIKGIDKAKELDKAIDFMILQSLSRGRSSDGRYSNKLHSLVIGAPASGKKLLTMIAAVLNPVALEVSSSAAKITPAGLVGNVIRKNNGMASSKPGYLPLASHGVLCIQDFHEVTRKENDLWGIFSKVMEDGEVIDSTSARTKHDAVTSIHVDMNKLSQVNPDRNATTFTDLNIPMNIISRFDFIIDIPPDIDRQLNIVLAMVGGEKVLSTTMYEFHDPEWKKKLKRIIAYLSTVYNKAYISHDVSDYLRSKFQTFIDENVKYREYQKQIPSMLTRLEISIEKLAKAIACAEMSEVVTKDHIDEAFDFSSYKLEFLKSYENIEIPKNLGMSKKDKMQARRNEILQVLSGRTLTKQEIYAELKEHIKPELTDKMIDRDLSVLESEGKVIHNKHGQWEFPAIAVVVNSSE